MLGRCLAVFATTHLLSVGSLTALLLLLQHALRNSSSAPTISASNTISFVHVVNVFSGSSRRSFMGEGRLPLLQEVREFTAAGFALLRMRDRWEYFQTKPPGGDEHGYALLFRDAAGCGENPFAAAPASAVAGWVILLLVCLLLANCAGTCILLGRTRRRRAELKRSASGEDEVLFVDT